MVTCACAACTVNKAAHAKASASLDLQVSHAECSVGHTLARCVTNENGLFFGVLEYMGKRQNLLFILLKKTRLVATQLANPNVFDVFNREK